MFFKRYQSLQNLLNVRRFNTLAHAGSYVVLWQGNTVISDLAVRRFNTLAYTGSYAVVRQGNTVISDLAVRRFNTLVFTRSYVVVWQGNNVFSDLAVKFCCIFSPYGLDCSCAGISLMLLPFLMVDIVFQKKNAFYKCWLNAGPSSTMLVWHQANNRSTYLLVAKS